LPQESTQNSHVSHAVAGWSLRFFVESSAIRKLAGNGLVESTNDRFLGLVELLREIGAS
jgi:hypothetical protein